MEFLDAHAHLWQVSEHNWYPALRTTRPELYRDHLPADYRAGAAGAGVRVAGLVHVSATSAPGAFIDETRWLDRLHAESPAWPSAIIGSVDPQAGPDVLDEQLRVQETSPAFRGVRVFSGLDPRSETTATLLRLLAERNLLLDQIIRSAEADAYAAALTGSPGTTVVLEHAGWPERDLRQWREGVARLAALPQVVCKLSGFGVALGTLDVTTLRPYVETCLELFGVERCFFGSNFPVDGTAGTYTQLMDAYQAVTAGLGPAERRALFIDNAVRCYKIG
ncbi:amidohydrolase family protein [Sphaerisporangium fuscum]|uniref:amidohydrolase family protein n=1 Tax=Sphaerisporangium fuscum TaxID=2835868 RepID=UPI001BDC0872|nr:amidohydrolase family protein [Sphaerisporangium fuscum]